MCSTWECGGDGRAMMRRTDACSLGYSEGGVIARGLGHSLETESRSMGTRFCKEAQMKGRRISKLVHEGIYVAEVEVETIYTDDGWSPYLSVEDA